MKDIKSGAEYANQKINEILNDKEDADSFNVDSFINHNPMSLVIKVQEKGNKK